MLTQGFRNLIKASNVFDESFQQLLKRSDEYRKSSRISLDYMQNIYKCYQAYEIGYEKIFPSLNSEEGEKQLQVNAFNQEFISIFEKVFTIQSAFGKKFNNNIRQTIEMSTSLFSNYSNLIMIFQSVIRNYVKNEQTLLQHSKRYFKNQKLLLQNLENYKISFTDVKLIYNNDQRLKRYIACENTYKAMMEDLKSIQDILMTTNKLKKQIAESYKNIEYEFVSAIKIVGNRVITLAELFVYEQKQMLSTLSSFLLQKSNPSIKIKGKILFSFDDAIPQEYYSVEVSKQNCKKYPFFIVYFGSMKPEFYPEMGRISANFIRQMSQRIQSRKRSERSLFELIFNFFKQYEKVVLGNLRDIASYYEKNKKKISQIYGPQHMSFLKTFIIFFEKFIENGDILNKSISLRIKTIDNLTQESAKQLDGFLKDVKACLEKHKKKQGKKAAEEDGANEAQLRVELQEKCNIIQAMIDSLLLRLNQSEAQLNIHCNAIINDMSGNALQLFEFCKQLHEEEFDQSIFLQKYQIFQAESEEIIKTKLTLFLELSFASLLSDKEEPITFEPELNKLEEFKKIKKPAEYQGQREGFKRKQSVQEKFNDLQKKIIETPKKAVEQLSDRSPDKSLERSDRLEKYEEFLLSKVAFLEEERFFKSYACGLSDKIILTGRLFITTQRLFFHSKFNPNNVFFGDTFIQIPKKDIVKVEKRQNAIIFNNSISVTTVNGEMFFTSFFSRNQAYDAICQALEINNNEDFMFEVAEEQQVNNLAEPMEVMDDDLKPEQALQRIAQIDNIMETFDYIEIHMSEYTHPGLNALKFFKMFDSSNEINYMRKTFKGFNLYFKELLEHRDIVVDEWTPTLNSCLNPLSIKNNCPLIFERISTSIIPVSNSGIPLMPKQAHLKESAKLYFYSNDKYAIVTKVENSGIPYCEYFNIRYKKVIQTIAQNQCRFTLYYYIEFVQKTMMRSVIQSKSIEESKAMTSRLEAQIRKYLKHLLKVQAKSSPKEQSKQQLDDRVNQLERELQESREREQKLEKASALEKQAAKKTRKWLVFSLVINIFLLLIIFSLF